MMKVCGVDNHNNTKHFVFPGKHIRYLTVDKGSEGIEDKFFIKVLGFRDRIRIDSKTFDTMRTALESV